MEIKSNAKTILEAQGKRAVDFMNWTIRQLPEDDQVSYFTARRIAAGETDIRLRTAVLLSKYLETPLDKIFETHDERL